MKPLTTFTVKKAHRGDSGRVFKPGERLTAAKWTKDYVKAVEISDHHRYVHRKNAVDTRLGDQPIPQPPADA